MISDNLLLRYIMGKAGKSERRQIISWLEESPENMNRFAEMKAKYVFSGFPNDIIPEKRRVSPALLYCAAALVLPLLVGVVYLYSSRQQLQKQYAKAENQISVLYGQADQDVTYIANPGTKSVVVLPDSSIVHLNGASRLVVPTRFSAGTREVFLSGEGYFEVTHHEDWPMRVQTPGGVIVNVLGTTFNLSAYSDDPNVKLTLIEGKVLIQKNKNSRAMEIRPNQEVHIATAAQAGPTNQAQPEIKEADIHKNTGWVNGELIFDNTPMAEIVRQLEHWYGVTIHIQDQDVMKYRLSASFTTESITRVMELLKFTSTLDYEINGTDVYIRRNRNQS